MGYGPPPGRCTLPGPALYPGCNMPPAPQIVATANGPTRPRVVVTTVAAEDHQPSPQIVATTGVEATPAVHFSPEDRLRQRIEHDFTYHAPHGDQVDRFRMLRDNARSMALLLVEITPVSREQSLAITALEECVAWANAAIARENR